MHAGRIGHADERPWQHGAGEGDSRARHSCALIVDDLDEEGAGLDLGGDSRHGEAPDGENGSDPANGFTHGLPPLKITLRKLESSEYGFPQNASCIQC